MSLLKQFKKTKHTLPHLLGTTTTTTTKRLILNIVIHLGIKYAFHATPFFTLDIATLDKLLIKLRKQVSHIPISFHNIFTELPKATFGVGTTSPLSRYATTFAKQMS